MTNLSYPELVSYLDKYSTDPIVRQLINCIYAGDGIVEGLVDVGMDPTTQEFEDAYSYYSPGEYILHLRNECDSMEQELRIAQDDLSEMTDERDRLKARGVIDLIKEVERERTMAREAAYEANKKSERLERENAELTEKINVWTIMERN